MFGADKGTADKLDGKKLHIGIVQARFNESITNTLAAACRTELLDTAGARALIAQLGKSGWRQQLRKLSGYVAQGMGEVVTPAEGLQ